MNRFLCLLVIIVAPSAATAQVKPPPKKEPIPHGQSAPPGPALTPQEALKKMRVPPGFHVELVAAEPDIVNPVSMTFDDRGRVWITESIEYPRRSAGPGKDRVKVLESTKGDGKFDKITTVIEGLNIPSGIAVGHGGVWVANSPDILFYPFEDFARAKLGKPQVVVTGFGRSDTHELPNSLTWGPDGWLYGLNGVFNPSHVKNKNNGKEYKFTCALFRIHPKTKDFEIFCEGTSNPWGIAIDGEGSFFVSACVIDHLWHLVETGYYHRQGGPYPPYTWKIGSIVKHRHQQAAYCGITWFDSDAYPPEYREKLYMGNVHGNCINCDELSRDGSTYFGKPALSAKPQAAARGVGEGSNFLQANDAWFMPVAQKTGPDGCLYILDWYDRYHCYQDANRDPAGIDRLNGRLYRVVYGDYKPAGKFDLRDHSRLGLVNKLESPNIYFRETAQHLLTERVPKSSTDIKESLAFLPAEHDIQEMAFDDAGPWSRKSRLHALWVRIGRGDLTPELQLKLLQHKDPTFRAWGVRALFNKGGAGGKHELKMALGGALIQAQFGVPGKLTPKVRDKLVALAKDPSPDVQLQVAIAARKCTEVDPMQLLLDVLTHCGDDKLIPHIVWQNLHPLLEKDGDRFLTLAGKVDLAKAPGVAKVLPRAIDRILGNPSGDSRAVVDFLDQLSGGGQPATAALCLSALSVKVQNGEITGPAYTRLKKGLASVLPRFAVRPQTSTEASLLWVTLGESLEAKMGSSVTEMLTKDASESRRLRALDALMTGHPGSLKESVSEALREENPKMPGFRGLVLTRLGKLSDPWVAATVLDLYPKFTPDEQSKAIELLTQRATWAKSLFAQIVAKKMSRDVININQARRLLAAKDLELTRLVGQHWGIPRDSRNPQREKIAAEMKELFRKTPSDPRAGMAVFKKVCAQCHKLHGEGVDVGPDITSNGRADFDQLLSNVFDPSLVIGTGYQAVTVTTTKGQVISGLLVEDSKQRVILKVQGGELKTIARKDVDEQFTSKVSLMPEDLEKQLQPQEIVDLLSYLSLDRSPDDPKAKRIPGTPK